MSYFVEKVFYMENKEDTLVTKIKNCVTGITKKADAMRQKTGLVSAYGLSLLRLRERHRPAGVSLDVEMMSVSSMLASIQD